MSGKIEIFFRKNIRKNSGPSGEKLECHCIFFLKFKTVVKKLRIYQRFVSTKKQFCQFKNPGKTLKMGNMSEKIPK